MILGGWLDFKRSTTTVYRTAESYPNISGIDHTAYFGVIGERSSLPDAGMAFRFWPDAIVATFRDGKLYQVKASGPRMLKSGEVSGASRGCRVWVPGMGEPVSDEARVLIGTAIDAYRRDAAGVRESLCSHANTTRDDVMCLVCLDCGHITAVPN